MELSTAQVTGTSLVKLSEDIAHHVLSTYCHSAKIKKSVSDSASNVLKVCLLNCCSWILTNSPDAFGHSHEVLVINN